MARKANHTNGVLKDPKLPLSREDLASDIANAANIPNGLRQEEHVYGSEGEENGGKKERGRKGTESSRADEKYATG